MNRKTDRVYAERFEGSVAVLGLGYIGLPTATVLASHGLHVVGVDINPAVVEAVNRGEVPFVEPDLGVAVSGAVTRGFLSAAREVPVADAFIVAVPTPFADDHVADLTHVRAAAEAIAPQLRRGALVILESTSPPGTTAALSGWLAELRPDLGMPHAGDHADVAVAHCPERVLPGRIMIEMLTNDRVIGGITRHCAERAAGLYQTFCKGELVLTDAASAEMAKLVENAYRDVNIAFANELSLICQELRLDVWEVIEMANRHPRVDILSPGPGVGGHCIAVDPWFIVSAAPASARLIRTAREVNDGKPEFVIRQIVDTAERFRKPTVACLGLAFKANVDDLRESPAVRIVRRLGQLLPDIRILVAEPFIDQLPAGTFNGNTTLVSTREAIEEADIVTLLVDHDQFGSVTRTHLAGKVVYDTRGLWH